MTKEARMLTGLSTRTVMFCPAGTVCPVVGEPIWIPCAKTEAARERATAKNFMVEKGRCVRLGKIPEKSKAVVMR